MRLSCWIRTTSIAALLLSALCTPSAAQSDGAYLRKIGRTLQDPTLALEVREELVGTLLDLGGPGAIAVAKSSSIASHALAKKVAKSQKALLRTVGKTASKSISLQSKGSADTIAEHQKTVSAAGRDPNLTKAKVQTVSDPGVQALENLLTVSLSDLASVDQKLSQGLGTLRAQIDVLRTLQLDWDYAIESLSADEGVVPELKNVRAPVAGDRISSQLDAALEFEILLATPMSESDRSVFRANAALRLEIDASCADGIRKLNHLRVLLGKNALRIDTKLCEAGADHSADMERLDFFAHRSPVEGKETFSQRASNFGTSASSENIAQGQSTGPQAITGWWYSPGHHRNMMGSHGRVGIGRSGRLWTQMFGG